MNDYPQSAEQPADQSEEAPPNKARRETLAIPAALREEVDERDRYHCRVCGKHLGEQRALHHIRYGGNRTGMGGRREHDLTNLITVCWMWGGNCHDLVHSSKHVWLPLLERTVATPGVTAMQLRRWGLSAQRRPQGLEIRETRTWPQRRTD